MSDEITVKKSELNRRFIYGIISLFLGILSVILALSSSPFGFFYPFFGGILMIMGGIFLIMLRIAKPEVLRAMVIEQKKKKKYKGKKNEIRQVPLTCSKCGFIFSSKIIRFCPKCGLKRKLNIFISYSTLDTEHFMIPNIAVSLEDLPEINKAFYWKLDSGINIVDFMEQKLSISDIFVLFCSAKALNSKSVKGEWTTAYELKKKGEINEIISVYEEEKFIPNLLIPYLKVKFNENNFESFIREMYSIILRK